MNTPSTTTLRKRWTAAELMKLPPDQRDAIVEQAADRAQADYHGDPELTGFEAFGTKDLYGGSAGAQAR